MRGTVRESNSKVYVPTFTEMEKDFTERVAAL